ncbi:MAG TPA: LysR family transcriptional regulator [Xanthobacteraceae bacterium]|jgi:DNA-binding transcriptional LysR family regulator|nr:LysR family transcriptional regulator [Xanthobacteraceae bacterium]
MDISDRIERRLKLHDLRVLISVVQAGSMSKAAERLGTAQPALSRSIAELEHALGVRLLDRSPRGVEPTDYGRALIKRGIAVFDELRLGVKDIEFLSDPTTGELRIGAGEAIANGPVLGVIERLSRQYPRISIHLMTGVVEQLCDKLAGRTIEMAIVRLVEPILDRQFVVENLFSDPFVVAAGARNPWTRRRRIQLAELVNEPWVLLPFDTLIGALVAAGFRASGVEPPRATVFTQSRNVRDRLLATGRFLSALPSFSLHLPGGQLSLKALPLALPGTQRPVGIITLKTRTLSPLAQLFAARIRAAIKPLTNARKVQER